MSEQPPDLVQCVMLATWNARYLKAEQRAIAAIAAVRAYDEAQVEHLSAFLRAISIRPDEADMQRADEPATERAPPADGWEAF
jgi:hypothetical protein